MTSEQPAGRPLQLATEPGGDERSLSQLGAEVLELVRRAASSGTFADISDVADQASPEAALRRLVLGRACPGDGARLGFPVEGSRLVRAATCAGEATRLAAALQSDRGDVVACLSPDDLVVLVRHMPRAAGDDRGLRDARRLAARVHRQTVRAAVGISAPLTSPESCREAAEEASGAARLARSSGIPTVESDDCWAPLALLRLRRCLGRSLTDVPPVERLRAYDARHRTDLAQTLATWLLNNQDSRRTAEELMIHVNTLRYRLRRATELAGLDLDDPQQRIVVQLALTLVTSSDSAR